MANRTLSSSSAGNAPGSPPVARESSPSDIVPMIDQWYIREDTQEKFVVTDYDESSGAVEIQTAQGDLDEIDAETWHSVPMVLVDQSQDLAGSLDSELGEDDDIEPVDEPTEELRRIDAESLPDEDS